MNLNCKTFRYAFFTNTDDVCSLLHGTVTEVFEIGYNGKNVHQGQIENFKVMRIRKSPAGSGDYKQAVTD